MIDSDDEIEIIGDFTWGPVTGENIITFEFTAQNVGIHRNIALNYVNKTPLDFLNLFINDDIINLMVDETNANAFQNVQNVQQGSKCRLYT